MKKIFTLLCKLLVVFNLFKCAPKEHFYQYTDQDEKTQQPNVSTFNPNDFKINFHLGTDSRIKEKENVGAIFIQLAFLGQHQYYPPNLRFEVFLNDEKVAFSNQIEYSITTVVDGRVTYYKETSSELNIPALIQRIKLEKNLPEDHHYFSIVTAYPKYYLNNTENPETINIKLITYSDAGSNTMDKTYTLQKIEFRKEKYSVPVRPFG